MTPSLLALLVSCHWVTEPEHLDFVDADRDGYYADIFGDGDDCDDFDAAIHPGGSGERLGLKSPSAQTSDSLPERVSSPRSPAVASTGALNHSP